MTATKQGGRPEPLLSAVARRLGYAAGKVKKVTQELTEAHSAIRKAPTVELPETPHSEVLKARKRLRSKRGASSIPKKRIKVENAAAAAKKRSGARKSSKIPRQITKKAERLRRGASS